MTSSQPPAKRIEVLLNTLLHERYARRALLSELVDELAAAHVQAAAVDAAQALLHVLDAERVEQGEYERQIHGIIELAYTRPALAGASPHAAA